MFGWNREKQTSCVNPMKLIGKICKRLVELTKLCTQSVEWFTGK